MIDEPLTKEVLLPAILTQEQVSERWNLSVKTLELWRDTGTGPLFLKLGRRIFYRARDIAYFEVYKLRDLTAADTAPEEIIKESNNNPYFKGKKNVARTAAI